MAGGTRQTTLLGQPVPAARMHFAERINTMHFVTLATVTIPPLEEDEQMNAKVAEEATEYENESKGTYMESYYRSRYQCIATTFRRAVFGAVEQVMEPFWENTEDPACLEFFDRSDDLKEEYEYGTLMCVQFPNGMITETYDLRFSNEFCVSEGVIYERHAGQLHRQKRTKKAKRFTLLQEYPIRKLYHSWQELAESRGYSRNENADQYGFFFNPHGHWDWFSIGGRWPRVFLVSDQCKEYSPGERDYDPGAAPEGYMWVSAARKKDIAWDAMRDWRKQSAIKRYDELKSYFETGIKANDYFEHIKEDGVYGYHGLLYAKGESQEQYLRRCGISDDDQRYPDSFYNYIDDGEWYSFYDYEFGDKKGEDAEEKWHNNIHNFISDLPDDEVLVVVDCHC